MSERIISIAVIAAAIGAGLTGGVFFAFSVSVMSALSRVSTASGIAVMQQINIVILNPLFFLALFGPALLGIALLVAVASGWVGSGGVMIATGALIYLIGLIGVTMVFNVPMNDALAAVDPASAQGAAVWQDYLSRWTMWNHVRTIAGVLSTLAFILALR
jgi:uncharacterized membrane protein